MSKIALFLQALELHGYNWNLEGFISSIPPELSYNWTDGNDGFETSIPNKIPLPSPKIDNQELPVDDSKLNLNLKEIALPISILLNLTLALLLVCSCVCKKKQETKCQCEQLQQFV